MFLQYRSSPSPNRSCSLRVDTAAHTATQPLQTVVQLCVNDATLGTAHVCWHTRPSEAPSQRSCQWLFEPVLLQPCRKRTVVVRKSTKDFGLPPLTAARQGVPRALEQRRQKSGLAPHGCADALCGERSPKTKQLPGRCVLGWMCPGLGNLSHRSNVSGYRRDGARLVSRYAATSQPPAAKTSMGQMD
jgi:hypothetical protein